MGCQDDYSRALFLKAYGNAKSLKQNNGYQRYFINECGITNPRAYHEQLITDGFLIPSSTAETLKGYKISELKELCDSFGIVKTGKKQDIIERLIRDVSPELLKNCTNKEQCYSLSEKGVDFLSKHEDYIECHRNTAWGISLDEYTKEKANIGENDFYKIALHILNKKLSSTNTDGFRNIYYSIAQIYAHTGDMATSLKNLLLVLFFDVNWTPNQALISKLAPSDDIADYYHFNGFAPGLIKDICNLKDYYNEQMVNEIYKTYSYMSPYVCPKALFIQLINDIYNKPSLDRERYAEIFKQNFGDSIKTQYTPNTQGSIEETQTGNAGCMITMIAVVVFVILALLFFM